jgi:DNA-binding protein HU-beta
MAKSMTKSQIADHVAQKAGLTKKAAVQLLDDFAALAYREAKNVFVVPGIGKLV